MNNYGVGLRRRIENWKLSTPYSENWKLKSESSLNSQLSTLNSQLSTLSSQLSALSSPLSARHSENWNLKTENSLREGWQCCTKRSVLLCDFWQLMRFFRRKRLFFAFRGQQICDFVSSPILLKCAELVLIMAQIISFFIFRFAFFDFLCTVVHF